MRYCAFDLEIVKEIPNGCPDWRPYRPLGISCAAIMCSDDIRPTLWFHGKYGNEPLPGAMTADEVSELVDYLYYFTNMGYHVVSWNGLGFDFDILAEESRRYIACKELALNHIDMMFHFLCSKGYPLGLNTAAHGLGLAGKTEGMHGDLAPAMWAKSTEDRRKVLEYVGQDARTTLEVAEKAEKNSYIGWISKSGKRQVFNLPYGKWLTVSEAAQLPKPDTAWMTNPMKREDLLRWTTEEK